MNESTRVVATCGFQQREGAHHVGAHELGRAVDAVAGLPIDLSRGVTLSVGVISVGGVDSSLALVMFSSMGPVEWSNVELYRDFPMPNGMIKPDAMRNGHAGAILDKIIKAGFRVVALKQTKLTEEKAGQFYEVHKERPFYGELVQFMSSGVIIAAILEKDNAVADFRKLIGATNPAQAEEAAKIVVVGAH